MQMKNTLTISEFKHFLKHEITSIDELLVNDLKTDIRPGWKIQLESECVRVLLNKFYIDNKLMIASDTRLINISSYYLITKNSTTKYLNLLKKRNVKLNYRFIKYLIEETTSLPVISWCIANADYLDQWMQIDLDEQKYNRMDDRNYWFLPKKTNHFIYNCLRNNEMDKVKIFAKTKFNINEDNLFERMFIELNSDSDWDIFDILNLFALNDNFDWDAIDPIMQVELMYKIFELFTIEETFECYPNVFANKKIKNFFKLIKIQIITDEQIKNYKNKYILLHEREFEVYGFDYTLTSEICESIRNEINDKIKLLIELKIFMS